MNQWMNQSINQVFSIKKELGKSEIDSSSVKQIILWFNKKMTPWRKVTFWVLIVPKGAGVTYLGVILKKKITDSLRSIDW